MENYISSEVENFLDFVNAAVESYEMALSDISRLDQELSDIEHYLELENCDAVTLVKLAKKLRDVRRERRNAKETIEVCKPICQWADDCKKALSALGSSKTLQAIKNIEYRQNTRVYTIRSDILKDVTSKTHLTGGDA